MKKNKILLAVSKSISFNLFLSEMSKDLKKKYTLTILTSDKENIFDQDLYKININLESKIFAYFNIFSLLKNIITTNIKLFKYRGSILFLHTPNISFFLRIFIFFKFKKIIYFVHGFRFHKNENWFRKKFYYYFEKLLSYKTDYYITINNEDSHIVEKKFKKNFLKLNGVGIRPETILKSKKITNYPIFKIGVLSAYRKNKGYDKIFKIAQKLDNNFLIDCYGYDFKSNYFNSLVRKNNKNIILNDFTNEVYNKIDSFNILLHLSDREGLSMSVLQSLSRGVPVIGHNIRGVNDLIIHGYNGYLFDKSDDVDNITKIITKLSNDKYHLQELSNNSIESFDEKFTTNYINKLIINFFDNIK